MLQGISSRIVIKICSICSSLLVLLLLPCHFCATRLSCGLNSFKITFQFNECLFLGFGGRLLSLCQNLTPYSLLQLTQDVQLAFISLVFTKEIRKANGKYTVSDQAILCAHFSKKKTTTYCCSSSARADLLLVDANSCCAIFSKIPTLRCIIKQKSTMSNEQ